MEECTSEMPVHINDVPDQCLASIFALLPSSTLLKILPLVCSRWCSLVRANPELVTAVYFDFRRASERHYSVLNRTNGARFIPCKKRIKQWLSHRVKFITELAVSNTENHGPEESCALRRHDFTVNDWPRLLHTLPNLKALAFSCCNDVLPNLHVLSDLVRLQELRLEKLSIPFASSRCWMHDSRPILGSGYGGAPGLGALTDLTTLVLGMDPPSADGFLTLPDAWSALLKLKELKLSGHYKLKTLPKWLSALTDLESIVLTQCDVKTIPSVLQYLPNLTSLDLSCNQLDQAGMRPGSHWWFPKTLTGLKHLRLKDCELRKLPPDIALFSRLVTLDMSSNSLAACSPGYEQQQTGYEQQQTGNWSRSQFLCGADWEAVGRFDDLQYCTALESLDLSNCSLNRFPSGIPHLTSLKVLNLSGNKALCVPENELAAVKSLPQLVDLNLLETTAVWPAQAGHLVRNSAKEPWHWQQLQLGAAGSTADEHGVEPAPSYPLPPLLEASYFYHSMLGSPAPMSPNRASAQYHYRHRRGVGWWAGNRGTSSTAPSTSSRLYGMRDYPGQHARPTSGGGASSSSAARAGPGCRVASTLDPHAAEFVPTQQQGARWTSRQNGTMQTSALGSLLFAGILPTSSD